MTSRICLDIAYQPLGLANPVNVNDDDQQLDVGDDERAIDDEDPVLEQLFLSQRSRTYRSSSHTSKRNTCVSLRQIRAMLLIVATTLSLTFLVQLTTNHDISKAKFKVAIVNESSGVLALSTPLYINITDQVEDPKLSDIAHIQYVKLKHPNHGQLTSHPKRGKSKHPKLHLINDRPEYSSYLLSVLLDHGPSSEQLGFPADDISYSSNDHRHAAWWELNFRLGKKIIVLENYVRAMKSFSENSSVTLTTQATTNFMHHVIELCKRWDGPISLAVFSPGTELPIALTMIKYLRQCLPAPVSACIRDKVTWHLAYHHKHGPPASAISFPRSYLDEVNYPLFTQFGQCPKIANCSNDSETARQFEIELRKKNHAYPQSYRQQFDITYPINVLRNTARQTAQTKYVLASDIELYPSANLVPYFINMLRNHDLSLESSHASKHVFTLPLFEVESNVTTPPRTKQELARLFRQGQAIFFHKWVCDACQKFPDRLEWLKSKSWHDHRDELSIFRVTRRDKSRQYWEPIFIGTKDDPEYDDRLTWDGRRDKMGQMYEMCLRGYRLFVLDNAFLVHAPGIKHLDMKEYNSRLNYIRDNNAIYDERIAKLREQYKLSEEIKIC